MPTDEQLNNALLNLQRMADITDSFKAAREVIETLKAAHDEIWVLNQKKADIYADIEALKKYQQQIHDETVALDGDFQATKAETAKAIAELLSEVGQIKVIRDDQTKLSGELKAQEQAAIDDLKAQKLEAENDLARAKANFLGFLASPTA